MALLHIDGYTYNATVKTSVVDPDRGKSSRLSSSLVLRYDLERTEENLRELIPLRNDISVRSEINSFLNQRRWLKKALEEA